ncbi:MAG: radical SAM protein [Deltaproteobacteria bacterium]|nr:radical SAM protein [Deltaproteobacteria bacterium]
MRYLEPIFRPPSEANSYILQVTYGCSHNQCTFCGMYQNKSFRVRPFQEVIEDIQLASQHWPDVRRVFLADGDAMILSTEKLLRILQALTQAFPRLSRVGIYADARSFKGKTDDELSELRKNKLGVVYLGLESGNNRVLEKIKKGATAEQMIEPMVRARTAGIKTSVIALLGVGGTAFSKEHAQGTAEAINAMGPNFFSALTLTLVPGTQIFEDAQRGLFTPLSPEQSLEELYQIVENIHCDKPVIFRTNHASNYVSLEGNLPRDKGKILETIRNALKHKILKPEWLRGL